MTIPWNQETDAIVAALLNGTFQGAVLCAMIWVVMRYCRGLNASTRYLIWLGALGWICLLPFSHFLLARTGVGQDVRPVMADRSTPVHSPGASDILQTQEQSTVSFEHPSLHNPPALTQEDSNSPLPEKDLTTTWVDRASMFESVAIPETPRISDTYSGRITATEPDFSKPSPFSTTTTKNEHPRPFQSKTFETFWPPFLSLSLLSGLGLIIAFKWIRLFLDLILLMRLKKEAMALSLETERFIAASNLPLQSRRHVRVKMHPTIKTPLALGFFRPMILLPQSLAESTDESKLACILRHEWAHIARYDDWTNLIQRFLEAMFFFHPAVAYIGRRLDTEREIACDDHVLADGSRAKDYALMLTQFANRERDRHLATATAGWNKKHQIKERIDMLLDYHRNTAPRPARVGAGLFTLATLAVGIIAMQLSPRLALAQSTGSESAAPSSADDLFAEPVQQPRTKTTQKVQIINQQPSALDKMEAMQTVSESLLAEEEPVELYSFGDDVLLPSLNAPESPRIPLSNMTTAPDSMFTQGLSQPKDTRKPVRIRGRQSSSQQAEAEAENYFDDMESNPFKQHVETDYGHTLQMLAQVTPEAEFNHRSHSESGLEKRLDALEGLVHRLLETNARQKASSGMQRREGDVYAEHQNQASTADAVPNPYAGLLNEQSIRQNTTRYHRQTTRSARQESLDGLAKLREEKAKLEAERQRLQEKLTTLEKQVQTLTIKMLQEMQEIESGNQTRNMP